MARKHSSNLLIALFVALTTLPLAAAAQAPAAPAVTDSHVRVSLEGVAKAPWYHDEPTFSLSYRQTVATESHAITFIGNIGAWLGAERDGRVIGPLDIPDHDWLGLDAKGGILIADSSGTLRRAPSLKAAISAAAFNDQADIPGATRWDLAGSTLLAANMSEGWVRVSRTAGADFAKAKTWNMPLIAAFARADGAVVVQTANAVHVNRRGKRWVRTDIGIGDKPLQRVGSWIGRMGLSSCGGGALAATGRTWVYADKPEPRRSFFTPFSLLSGGDARKWFATTNTTPSAPGTGLPRATRVLKTCRRSLAPPYPDKVRQDSSSFFGRADNGRTIAAPRNNSTRLRFGLMGHTKPTIVLVDTKLVRVLPTPPGCKVKNVLSLNGIAAAGCADGSIHIIDTMGAIQESLAGGKGKLTGTVAWDGTVLVQTGRDKNARSWLRQPVALGTPNAWREVTRPDTLAYRPVPGGRLLTLHGTEKGPYRVEVDGKRIAERVTLEVRDVDGIRPYGADVINPVVLPDGRIEMSWLLKSCVLNPRGALSIVRD